MRTDFDTFGVLFTRDHLDRLFPRERTDQFFEALLGDSQEGAYDIRLTYKGFRNGQLHFEWELRERPGKCLSCNLTYGLPNVFARHPVIDIQNMVAHIDALMDGHGRCAGWRLESTREIDRGVHGVPLIIDVER